MTRTAALFLNPHARAILWAQFRSLRNRLPRANKAGLALTIFVSILWYGLFTFAAIGSAALMSQASEMTVIHRVLPGGLLLTFLYWVLIPVMMASKGSSLELPKLLVYPIPHSEFWRLEMLLRLSVGIEPLIVITGTLIGLLLNSAIPHWAPFVLLFFVVFTMCFAAGFHDLLGRLMSRRGVREIVSLLFILVIAVPQLLIARGEAARFAWMLTATSWQGWPWSAAAQIAAGAATASGIAVLLAWTVAGYGFGRWQFARTLRFDESEAGASRATRLSRFDWVYRWPSLIFRDPTAALVEKEVRFLSRSSRFRLVFLMGFSFGLIIWWPVAFGRYQHGPTFMSNHFMAVVSMYAILLLSEVLFWNTFGFDRAAAQLYFVIPVAPRTVLIAKNIGAAFYVLLEITLAIVICLLLRFPMTPQGAGEAYALAAVTTLLLISIGNMTSFYSPRPVDPSKSFRSSRGRVELLLLLVYPIVAIPIALAYLARYAFASDLAFYATLLLAFGFAIIVYRLTLDSALALAERNRESILAALRGGEGPIDA